MNVHEKDPVVVFFYTKHYIIIFVSDVGYDGYSPKYYLNFVCDAAH